MSAQATYDKLVEGAKKMKESSSSSSEEKKAEEEEKVSYLLGFASTAVVLRSFRVFQRLRPTRVRSRPAGQVPCTCVIIVFNVLQEVASEVEEEEEEDEEVHEKDEL